MCAKRYNRGVTFSQFIFSEQGMDLPVARTMQIDRTDTTT